MARNVTSLRDRIYEDACNDSPQSRAEAALWAWCSLAVAVCVGIVLVFRG